ncbi:hypothetical protein ACIOHC_36335 [Streptomyces sp. NPDC088252]|uniref:hypothetical protein n=1 Tax=Streptomyces sp. NPDC088252 TaxID=3365845 RepID=UPI003829C558
MSADAKSLTRKEGGQKYLELVKPYNDALDKCMGLVGPIMESMASSPDDFPKIRKACAAMPDATRQFAAGLEAQKWPAEARKDIARLVDENRADQLAWEGLAKVRVHDDLFNPKYPFNEDGDAAALVRAHLGLPPREDVG